jgi:hypothetical protein
MFARSAQPLSLIFIVFCLLFASAQPAAAQLSADPAQVIANAVAYLKTQQQPDGGILGFAGTSDPDTTIRTVLALVANGQALDGFTSPEGNSLLGYLESQADAYVHDPNGLLFPGRAGLLLSAVALGGEDVQSFGGFDLSAELAATFQPDTGAYATEAALDYSSGAASDLNQAWAILGLALSGQPIPTQATFYLAGTQAEDGSWAGGDPDTTALALTALLASRNVPLDDPMISQALQFFKSTQLANGGWKPGWDQDPLNADTTGWAAQALISASDPASSVPWQQAWTAADGDPVSALLSLVKEDGSIGGTYVNAYSTADALIGLAQAPLSYFGLAPAFQRAGLVVQNGDGSLLTTCVAFMEESLTGFELLSRSGFEIASVTDPSLGTAVCGIGAEGCPSSDCFCGMPDYWSYWQPGEGDWAYAVSGAEQSLVKDGTLEAWSWGQGLPPALLTFEQVCQPGSLQPASVAVLSQSAAPAYPEPAAPTEVVSVESYPEPTLADAPTLAPTELPASAPASVPTQASAEAPRSFDTYYPYLVLGGLLTGLVIAVLVLARRKK